MFVSYNLEDFGKELRKARKNIGLTQAEVQGMVGVSVDAIRKIETGRVMARYDTLELLSVAYKQDLLELLKNCRANKFLMEYHDDMDYIITCYDKEASARLKQKLRDSSASAHNPSLINPIELRQFIAFVDAIDAYYSEFTVDRENIKMSLIKTLRYTLPDYSLSDYKKYKYNYIEFRILLLISLLIAKEGDYTFSNQILLYILKKITDSRYTTRYIDFLIINIYFNVSYNNHLLKKHDHAIKAAEAGISYCLRHKTCHALFSLYYRKGIAQYFLGDAEYLGTITTAFYLLKALRIPDLLEQYWKITQDKYGITVALTK